MIALMLAEAEKRPGNACRPYPKAMLDTLTTVFERIKIKFARVKRVRVVMYWVISISNHGC